MRIAYVTLHWPRKKAGSTGQKIMRHMKSWEKAGHEVRFFSHSHPVSPPEPLVDGEVFFYAQQAGLAGRIRTEFSRVRAARKMIAAVRDYHPDLIYLRWSIFVFPIHQLLDIAPTVVEINTNDVDEHKRLGPLFDYYNRLTRGILLGRAAGHVYATNEIAEMDGFRKFRKPDLVLGNSLDLNEILPLDAPDNDPPHLLFIGTPGLPWHGVEKLIGLARSFPDLIIDVVGYTREDLSVEFPLNVHMHGYRSGDELQEILTKADCAIATMAYHSIGLNEASPFKTRQYLALGIPTILPYQDTDLYDLDAGFLLKIPNGEDNIKNSGVLIHGFIQDMRGKRVPRELVFDRIDSGIKESRRMEFFQQIANPKNHTNHSP